MNRRKLLLQSGGWAAGLAAVNVLPPLEKLFRWSLQSLVNEAQAETTGQRLRNYVQVVLPGAPPRWYFDHWLQSHSGDPTPSPMIITRREASFYHYRTSNVRGTNGENIALPSLWQTPLPRGQLRDLLPHLLVVRGFGTGIDGHPDNLLRQMVPVQGVPSISGVVADHSQLLYPGLVFPSSGPALIRGEKSSPYIVRGAYNANLLNALFSPFQVGNAKPTDSLRSTYRSYLDEVSRRLASVKEIETPNGQILRLNTDKALARIRGGVNNLASYWEEAYNRYNTLMNNTLRAPNIQGLNDSEIVVPPGDFQTIPDFKLTTMADHSLMAPGENLCETLGEAHMGYAAAGFALAEFALREEVASCIEISRLNIYGIRYRAMIRSGNNLVLDDRRGLSLTDNRRMLNFDSHESGRIASWFYFSHFFRALGGALLEMQDQLSSNRNSLGQNLYEQTVIHLLSEFGRTPRLNLSGSDHGYDAMISSFLSGAFRNGPAVVGNILREYSEGEYVGFFGQKAPTRIDGVATDLSPVHMASTAVELLGATDAANPFFNLAAPLVKLAGTGLDPRAEAKAI